MLKKLMRIFLLLLMLTGFVSSLLHTQQANAAGSEILNVPDLGSISISFVNRTEVNVTFPNTPVFNNNSAGPTFDELFSGQFKDPVIDGNFTYTSTTANSCGNNPELILGRNGEPSITNNGGDHDWRDLPEWNTGAVESIRINQLCVSPSTSASLDDSYSLFKSLAGNEFTWSKSTGKTALIEAAPNAYNLNWGGINISMFYSERESDGLPMLTTLGDGSKGIHFFYEDGGTNGQPAFVWGEHRIQISSADAKIGDTLTATISPATSTDKLGFYGGASPFSEVLDDVLQNGAVGIDQPIDSTATCENSNNNVSWLLCPVVDGAADNIGGILGFITRALDFNVGPSNASNGTYRVWDSFKTITNVFFVIAMLFIVYAQATGSMLDAYSVKKMLPRLVIAVIAVQLSFWISSFAIELTNELGRSLVVIIDNMLGIELGRERIGGIVLAVVGGSALAIGGAFIGLFAITPIILGLLISLIAVVFTFAFRSVLLTVLVILSPLAFLVWVLPGTEKYFSIWWQNFSKLLLMYPMIILLIEAGKIVAVASSGGNAKDIGFWGMIYMFAPYLMIPFTFKFAGGAIAAINNSVSKYRSGVQEGSRRRAEPEMARKRSEFLSGTRTQGGKFGDIVDKVGMGIGVGSKSITRPSSFKGRLEMAKQAAANMRAEEQNFKQMSVNSLAMAANAFGEDYLTNKIDGLEGKTDDKSNQMRASYEQALSLSKSLPKTNAQRQASLMALASSGYEFSAGTAGYAQLQTVVAELSGGAITDVDSKTGIGVYSGPNAGMYGNLMNEAQYRLKGANRYDLAGINYGTGYSFDKGLGKADSFTIGRGAIETVTSGREVLGASATKTDIPPDEFRTQTQRHLSAALTDAAAGKPEALQNTMRWRARLKAAKNSATGANLEEINTQLSAIDGAISSFRGDILPGPTPSGKPLRTDDAPEYAPLRAAMLEGERYVSTYDSEQLARRGGGVDPYDPHLLEEE